MSELIRNLQMKKDLVNLRLKGNIPQKYKDIIRLYFMGKNYKEIAKTLNISEMTANTRLARLRKNGLIGKKQTKTETVMQLLKIGINDNKQIADLLDISPGAVSKLKVGANIRLKEYEENLGIESHREEETRIITPKLVPEIKEILSYRYPIEIANAYDVPVSEVYNIIYSLTNEEKRKIKRKALKENSLYKKIKDEKESKNISAKEAMEEIYKERLSVQDRINLARIYYIMGNSMRAQRILMNAAYDKTVSIEQRIMAREEADKMHFNDLAQRVRKDYITRNPNGELLYFDDLMKKYKVGYIFLTEVIGPEDEIDFNDLEH